MNPTSLSLTLKAYVCMGMKNESNIKGQAYVCMGRPIKLVRCPPTGPRIGAH